MRKNRMYITFRRVAMMFSFLLLGIAASAQAEKSKYACTETNPEQLCNAGNTCGSASTPCDVAVKRTANGASATAQLPGAKGNSLFCVRPGTTVNWKSTSKNTGFVIDVSEESPFEPGGAIIGGSNRSVTVTAKKSGCYKYSVGACVSGAVSGMCANSSGEVIILPGSPN